MVLFLTSFFVNGTPTLAVGSFLLSQQDCANAQAVLKSSTKMTGMMMAQPLPLPHGEPHKANSAFMHKLYFSGMPLQRMNC